MEKELEGVKEREKGDSSAVQMGSVRASNRVPKSASIHHHQSILYCPGKVRKGEEIMSGTGKTHTGKVRATGAKRLQEWARVPCLS